MTERVESLVYYMIYYNLSLISILSYPISSLSPLCISNTLLLAILTISTERVTVSVDMCRAATFQWVSYTFEKRATVIHNFSNLDATRVHLKRSFGAIVTTPSTDCQSLQSLWLVPGSPTQLHQRENLSKLAKTADCYYWEQT